jgi:sulfite exporter TauE/SafE
MKLRKVKAMRTSASAPDVRVSLSFAVIAAALLLLGVVYYLAFRAALPAPLQLLHLRRLAPAGEPVALLGSLPSLIHVTAFGLLTCALLRPSVLSALVTGAVWAGIDVLWEFSCADHQAWLRAGSELIGVDSVPACTYAPGDVAASIAGAAAAAGIAQLVLKFHSVSPSTAQERQQ